MFTKRSRKYIYLYWREYLSTCTRFRLYRDSFLEHLDLLAFLCSGRFLGVFRILQSPYSPLSVTNPSRPPGDDYKPSGNNGRTRNVHYLRVVLKELIDSSCYLSYRYTESEINVTSSVCPLWVHDRLRPF